MKALCLFFQMRYGSPDTYEKWVNGRPKYWVCLLHPRNTQNMIIKYLSVGLQSWFSYQQVALKVLFQMRYISLSNSNWQPSDRLKALGAPIFTSKQDCFAYWFAQWALLGSANILFILVYHSVIPWSILSYSISYERALKYLSYDLKISNVY